MKNCRAAPTGAFTLIEVIIGMSLSLMIMAGVLSSYVFVARSFARTFGVSSANGASLESQGRRTLAYLAQDVAMARGIDTSAVPPGVAPSAIALTLLLPGSVGDGRVTYVYNPLAQTLTRTLGSGAPQTLHTSLLSCRFDYYDSSGHPYTSYTDYLAGVKQISLTFSSQAGTSSNGTLTQVYQSASPRLTLHNRTWLP